jgi:hypothetical protein
MGCVAPGEKKGGILVLFVCVIRVASKEIFLP